MNISNQEILGKTGEKIVSNYFQRQRMIVEHSIDNFDREKDLIVEGKNVEVKTMQPYVYKNAFSFRKNQLKKCKSVDRFVIVSVPPLINVKYKYGGKIFEVTSNFSYFEYTTKFGMEMFGINIEQAAVTELYTLSTPENIELLKYATSAYSKV